MLPGVGGELSGGQWQRVAIARGFYRAHGLIVLDEPTAAIDPLEETKIYRQFAEMAKDKTAVIVTHRLGSARIADRIVVLDKGKIAGIGTHDELIRPGQICPMFSPGQMVCQVRSALRKDSRCRYY